MIASGSSTRSVRDAVDGIVLLDKPEGLSSNHALQSARRLLNAAKAGHTGTLDPMASGLLPLCFGDATKFAQALLDAPKEYVARIRFGVATSTGDAEGEVVAEAPAHFDRAALERALAALIGPRMQVPPRHAALKYEGRKYYEYARAGVEIPRVPRPVTITALDLLAWDPPEASVRVACSKGTYVRVLAEEVAASLGTLAHLSALRRTRTGPFWVTDAVSLEALAATDVAGRRRRLLPVDAALGELPSVLLDAAGAVDLLQGRVPSAEAPFAGRGRAYGPNGRFLGVVEAQSGKLRARRLVQSVAGVPRAGGTGFDLE